MTKHHSITRRQFIANFSAAATIGVFVPSMLRGASGTEGAYPKVDLHVHLSDEITLEKLAQSSRATGCKYGIVEHPGPRYSKMVDDKSLNAYLDGLSRYGFYKGVQPVDFGWRKQFSKETLARLDYVVMDAMEIPRPSGGYEIIWSDDFKVEDVTAFMERYVAFYVRVLTEERPNILASPTCLPKSLRDRYEELWTNERMEKVIAAAVQNNVALEINSMYKIPSKRFVEKAKKMGARFSFGTNGRMEKIVGALDYSFETAKGCNLAAADIYVPKLGNK